MSFSATERLRLAATLLEVGPEAPTQCAGWTAHHLAAHLWLRERGLLATAGMFLPVFSRFTDRSMSQLLTRDFTSIVEEWGRGPFGLWRVLDRVGNVAEHFVHHEDVRRASGLGPREFTPAEEAELYAALKRMMVLLRSSSCRVIFEPEGLAELRAGTKNSPDIVRITGTVGEMLLWLYGRPASGLDFEGNLALVRKTRV